MLIFATLDVNLCAMLLQNSKLTAPRIDPKDDFRTWRTTTQPLLNGEQAHLERDGYRVFPTHPVNNLEVGFDNLAHYLSSYKQILIDGYIGIFWDDFRAQLDQSLRQQSIEADWVNVAMRCILPIILIK